MSFGSSPAPQYVPPPQAPAAPPPPVMLGQQPAPKKAARGQTQTFLGTGTVPTAGQLGTAALQAQTPRGQKTVLGA